MATSELACTYAALILHDNGIDVTAEKIATLVKTANVTVESYWPSLFAKLCHTNNINDLVMNTGAGSSTTFASVAVSSSQTPTQAAPATEEKKKEEVKEESEDDMVFGLFD